MDKHLFVEKTRIAYSDQNWKKLNVPGFLYCNLGGPKPNNLGLDSSSPGFLTGYSRFSIVEDKAEIFAWKIVRQTLLMIDRDAMNISGGSAPASKR